MCRFQSGKNNGKSQDKVAHGLRPAGVSMSLAASQPARDETGSYREAVPSPADARLTWHARIRLSPWASRSGRLSPRATRRIARSEDRWRAIRAEFSGKLPQCRDAVLGRWMRRKQTVDAMARERVDDEHVRRGRIALGLLVRHLMRSVLDLGERRGEPHWLTGDARA